jgi:hypothetical protein
MKRILMIAAVLGVLAWAAWSRTAQTPVGETAKEVLIQSGPVNPWNHLKFINGPSIFRFAIVTDRTGGPRAGVFERAVDQLNWLQPEFVVSVGDLIDGGGKDAAKLDKEWEKFNGWIAKLDMPFFYVPGNHDYASKIMEKQWHERLGKTYYHFVYKNVLFLMLNTEEPPRNNPGGNISKEQIDYAKKTLDANKAVRWTMVFLHRPTWTYKEVEKTGWPEVEDHLKGRKYTVFAGHKHNYQVFERLGQTYYMLATTGGSSKLRGTKEGEFDHLTWVTMKDTGPIVANLLLEGIYPQDVRNTPPYVAKPAKPKTETEKEE